MKRGGGAKTTDGAGRRRSGAARPRTATARAAGSHRKPARADAAPFDARRWGRWLAIAAVVVPPLVVVPGLLEPFRLPQRLTAEWLALASLVFLAVGSPRLSLPEAGEPPRAWFPLPALRTWLRLPPLQAALPLLLVAAASLLTTVHPAHVVDALADLAIGVAVLVGWSLALDVRALRRMLDAALVPAAALAVVGILQLHQIWQPMVFAEAPEAERLAVTSLAGNPGDLAAVLVLPLLVAQAGLREARGWRLGWRLLVLALCTYALAGTQTLTSLVAAAAGSAVLWAALLPRRRVVAAAAATVAVLLLLVALVAPLRQRVEFLWQSVTVGDGLNEVLSGRLDAWRVAARLLADHPLAGVGFGAYRAEFGPAKLRRLGEGTPFFTGHVNPSFASAHDEYLEVGADLGWPGLAALAWGIALVVRAVWRAGRRFAPADRALAWGGLVALALLALGYFPFRLGPVAFPALAWLAWLFAGESAEEAAP